VPNDDDDDDKKKGHLKKIFLKFSTSPVQAFEIIILTK